MYLKLAVILALLASILGCEDNASAPDTLGNGATTISSSMVGARYETLGNQYPGGEHCNWTISFKRDTDGKRINVASGQSGRGHWSQTVTFYPHMKGYRFFSDRCSPWKKFKKQKK